MKSIIQALKTHIEAFRIPQIRKRLVFTILILLLFRLIAHIPVPGVNVAVLKSFFTQNQFLAILDIFSGGTLANFSISALGLNPFINASVMFQLLGFVIPKINELKKEGEYGRQKLSQYTRVLTVPLAIAQALGMYALLRSQNVIGELGIFLLIAFMITMAAGTMLLVFLGELINQHGVGNGISLLIFSGIVSRYPIDIFRTITVSSDQRMFNLIAFGLMAVLVVAGIIFIDEAILRIPIRYARRQLGNRSLGDKSSYLPLKINTAGVMPIIFALSLSMIPQMLGNFLSQVQNSPLGEIGRMASKYFNQSSPVYNTLYFFLVVIFTYFYTTVVFNPKDVAEDLRKSGGFIPGVRPGKSTQERFSYLLSRVTVAGAFFLGAVAILPSITQGITGISTVSLGGTGILIVVSVVLELNRLIENLVQTWRYQSYIN